MKDNINKKSYWIWRNRKRDFIFRLKKINYKINQYRKDFRTNTRTNFRLVKNIILDVIKAAVFIGILLIFERLMKKFALSILSDMQLQYIASVLEFETSTFVLLLSTFASITGVFLGLYFSSVGNIIGATYAGLPKKLSMIFENEKIGNRYIRSLMRFIISCLFLLVLSGMGIKTSYITSSIITLYGCVSIMNFFNLGKLIYRYSDIVELSTNIIEEINKNLELVTITGVAWDDRSFQHHYHKNCSNQLDLLSTLVNYICTEDSRNSEPLVKIFNNTLYLLLNYQVSYKGKIPCTSMWFENKAVYNSWFNENVSSLQTSINTSTFIRSKMVPNMMWFEERIFSMITELITELIRRKDYKNIYLVLNVLAVNIESLLKNFEVKSVVYELNQLTSIVNKALLDSDMESESISEITNERVACTELISGLYVGIIVGIRKGLGSFGLKGIENFMNSKAWSEESAIHDSNLPHVLIKRLEDFKNKLTFEYKVEGKVVTSEWYMKQLLSLEYARELKLISYEVIMLFKNQLVEPCIQYYESEKFYSSYVIVSQSLTCYDRIQGLIDDIESIYFELKDLRVEADIPWVDIKFDELRSSLQEEYKKIIGIMGKCTLLFAVEDRSENVPDFFGHGYNYLYVAAFDALFSNDIEFFKELYKTIIKLTLIAEYKVRGDLDSVTNEQYKLTMSLNTVVDFIEFSGHGLFMAELTGDSDLRGFIISESDNVFESIKTKGEMSIYERYVVIYGLESNTVGIHIRSTMRTSWRQRMEHFIKNSDLIKEEYSGSFNHRKKVIHDSPLIRSFSYDRHMSIKFGEIYTCLYLNNKVEEEKKYKTRWGWEKKYLNHLAKEEEDVNV